MAGSTDPDGARPGFAETAEHISATERRAALAEREAIDRYLAAFMADEVGAAFAARISGVQRVSACLSHCPKMARAAWCRCAPCPMISGYMTKLTSR